MFSRGFLAGVFCLVLLAHFDTGCTAKQAKGNRRRSGGGGGGADGLSGLFDAFMSGNSGKAKDQLGGLSDLLNYGNWCGPDNTKEDPNHSAIDKIDEACRGHDLCLKDLGYHDCKCDKKFLKDLQKAEGAAAEPFGELYRSGAISIFKEKPCECIDGVTNDKIPGKGGKCSKKKQKQEM